jgi:hypothetical protein
VMTTTPLRSALWPYQPHKRHEICVNKALHPEVRQPRAMLITTLWYGYHAASTIVSFVNVSSPPSSLKERPFCTPFCCVLYAFPSIQWSIHCLVDCLVDAKAMQLSKSTNAPLDLSCLHNGVDPSTSSPVRVTMVRSRSRSLVRCHRTSADRSPPFEHTLGVRCCFIPLWLYRPSSLRLCRGVHLPQGQAAS